jgi:hypothetical protein
MKIPRIYVDTSVIGGCCDDEFAVWSEGLLRDFAAGILKLVLSELVIAELAEAPGEVLDRFNEWMECAPEIVEVSAECHELANAYLQRGVLAERFSDDALHVACATVAEVDVLVSWNFRHIVHMDRMRGFNAVNMELGYRPIQILSPREVTHHGLQDS